MKKYIHINTNWDSKKKSGGYGANLAGSNKTTISVNIQNTTTDKLVLYALIDSVKKFTERGDQVVFLTSNNRVKNAVRHPSNSIHCALAREFRAAAKACGVHYCFR